VRAAALLNQSAAGSLEHRTSSRSDFPVRCQLRGWSPAPGRSL
jgi:hypothetical protein